jgi:hypothetical protein
MAKVSNEVKHLLQVIGQLQDGIGKWQNLHYNDRSQTAFEEMADEMKEAFNLCVTTRSEYSLEDCGEVRAVKKYAIAFQRWIKNDAGPSTQEWIYRPEYGTHDRNIDAKRAYVVSLAPSLEEATDEFIKKWFDSKVKFLGGIKVITGVEENGTFHE